MPLVNAPPLPMSDDQRQALEKMGRSTSLPHRQVAQAKALLLAADGLANNEVARRCHTTNDSVRAWRRRFAEHGVEGVGRIAPGRGRKSWLPDGTVASVVADTLNASPDDGSTHWTTRLMAERFGIGKDTVARIWRNHNLKPWKVETFKLSNDPDFEDKLGRRRRPLPRSASESGRVQLRRKDPVPGPGPHPAVAAHDPGPGRDHDT